MVESERRKLQECNQTYIGIGITEGGIPRNAIGVPWAGASHAYNMRTPDIYFEESDLHDPEIMARLRQFRVVGCYIFVPLADYSFLAEFPHMEDVHIQQGSGVADLSFMRHLTHWFMFYLEDAQLENLDDLFLQADRTSTFHSFCLGLYNCRVEDVSAVGRSRLRLCELAIWGNGEYAKWKAVPALKYKYYELKQVY